MRTEVWRWVWLALGVAFSLGEIAIAGSFFVDREEWRAESSSGGGIPSGVEVRVVRGGNPSRRGTDGGGVPGGLGGA